MHKEILSKFAKFFYFGNRSFAGYAGFLKSALDDGFKFHPLVEFTKTRAPNEKIIGMRHDIDFSLDHALNIAGIEKRLGVKATYFVLHTARYFYRSIPSNIIDDNLIPKLRYLQNDLGHEVGLHLDLMTLDKAYNLDPNAYLQQVLDYLYKGGIDIFGVAPHGSFLTNLYRKNLSLGTTEERGEIYVNPQVSIELDRFGLIYEIDRLDRDEYYSDAKFVNHKRWDISLINLRYLPNRTIISTHPEHWSRSKCTYYTHNLYLKIKYTLEYLNHYITYRRNEKVTQG